MAQDKSPAPNAEKTRSDARRNEVLMRLRSAIVFAAGGLAVVGMIAAQFPSTGGSMDRSTVREKFSQLNALSRAASQQRDDVSVKAFTDAVTETYVQPGPAADILKDRLFELERQHRTTGISEESLARGINAFVERIGAPTFVKTNPTQLRMFRTTLHVNGLGDVVAPGLAGNAHGIESTVTGEPSEMSSDVTPSEAVILISTMLKTKMCNADFQVSPDEWAAVALAKKESIRKSRIAVGESGLAAKQAGSKVAQLLSLQPTVETKALDASLNAFALRVQSTDVFQQELERFIEESSRSESK